MYTVYQHINKINGKMYIGITRQISPQARWGSNGKNYKSTQHFYSAIEKYGWDNFKHNILYTNCTKEEACKLEISLIKQYHTQDRNFGYNILEGGTSPKMPQETRRKISKALMGNLNGFGHPCSDEKKRKISEAQQDRKFTEEHKRKLSKSAQTRHVPCSENKKKILSQNYPHKKQVYCNETNMIYESVHECARQLGLYAINITKVCKGIHHTTGGYHFEYYKGNDIENA